MNPDEMACHCGATELTYNDDNDYWCANCWAYAGRKTWDGKWIA